MPYKRLIIIIGIVLMLLLMIIANTENPSEGTSGGILLALKKTCQTKRKFRLTEEFYYETTTNHNRSRGAGGCGDSDHQQSAHAEGRSARVMP